MPSLTNVSYFVSWVLIEIVLSTHTTVTQFSHLDKQILQFAKAVLFRDK